ncbi:MAG: hydrogenase maturation protease [Myxococcota bacterium]
MRIRVVGIGSDFGDDAAGPRVVALLAARGALPEDVEAVRCSRPIELVDLLEGFDGAVLVDATVSGRPPGTVHEPALDELCEARPVSSHGLGVREALSMAKALGRAPERIAIVGVEALSTSGPDVSAPVREALERAAAAVRGRCDAWRASARGRP